MYVSANCGYVETFVTQRCSCMFFMFGFQFVVLIVGLGLGTKAAWLGLGNNPIYGLPGCVTTNKAGKCPEGLVRNTP